MNKARQSTMLTSARDTELSQFAEFIANEYAPNGRVEPAAIAKKKQITLSFNSYGDFFDGMLEHSSGRFHIYCNLTRVDHPESPRARFTLGHELGHYFIDEHRNALSSGQVLSHQSQCEYQSDLKVEREADAFSSSLLMSPSRFGPRVRSGKIGLATILAIAQEFGVSVTSAAIRYAREDYVPCAVVKWGPDSFEWKWLSTETFRARLLKTVETISKLPEDCATRRALNHETSPASGFFECGTAASAWFPFLRYDDYKNVIFIEQAISLGRFGVLTFLFPEGKKL